MTLIRAAVCHEPNSDLTIEEIELASPELDEVRVTVDACAICHSDITYIDGGWAIEYPVVLGHEISGKVASATSKSNFGGPAGGLSPGKGFASNKAIDYMTCRALLL